MEAEDRQIIAEVVNGATSEYRRLVDRYQLPVFRFTYNMLGNRHDAEDITQDVFVAAFSNLRSYDARRSAFLTWLLTIARNRCVNRWKRKTPEPTTFESNEPVSNDSHDDVLRREFWKELDTALKRLPLEQRSVFVLAEIEQQPYTEIAIIENVSLGTVKSRLHRAKQRLRRLLPEHVRDAS